MTRQKAKAILEMYRAGGQDAADPEFLQALDWMERDPELTEWFVRQQEFDSVMVASIKDIPVPDQLRASLLAQGPAAAVSSIWERMADRVRRIFNFTIIPERAVLNSSLWRRWSVRTSAVTIVTLAAFVLAMLASYQPGGYASYLNDVVAASWDDTHHVDLRTNDLATVRKWLMNQGVDSAFAVPPALQQARLHGARVFHWNKRPVAFLCYLDGPQHMHFLVSDVVDVADAPSPDALLTLECHRWTTYSWIQGGKAYVLTGPPLRSFIKRFRKDRQWLLKSEDSLGLEDHPEHLVQRPHAHEAFPAFTPSWFALTQPGLDLFHLMRRRLTGLAGAEVNCRPIIFR
jgi:hypothetical protein